MVKIEIDREKCIGCGRCTSVCPVGMYEIKNGKAHVKEGMESKCLICRACEANCPVGAISIKE